MTKLNYQRMSREAMLRNKPIVGDSRYSTRIGNDNSPVILNGPTYVLKFGKHKGKMLKDLPMEYIKWSIMNLSDPTVNMFIRELQRRDPSFKI